MSAVQIGLLFIVIMVGLFLVGVPVGTGMGLAGFVGFAILVNTGASVSQIGMDLYKTFTSYSYTTVPLFVLMGSLAFYSQISTKLYNSCHTIFGRTPGGLCNATIVACAFFGAITGSANAAAATMGKVCIPEMDRYGYDRSLSTSTVAVASTLGILIPPSGIFIIYGIMTENSVSKLFSAGIIPGILLAAMYCATIIIMCLKNPDLGPAGEKTDFMTKVKALSGTIDIIIVFLFVIGGMLAGWFTATQGGAMGALAVFILGKIHRTLSWKDTFEALKETVDVTCLSMSIVGCATIFGHFIARSTIPTTLAKFVETSSLPNWAIFAGIIVVYLIGGCIMDSLAMIVLTLPIFYPLIVAMGYDPIWFGVVIVIVTSAGLVTPPVGLNVYIVANLVPDYPMMKVFRGVVPLLIVMVLMVVLLMLFPGIATWLPSVVAA